MQKSTKKKDKGTQITHVQKSKKINLFIYKLSNGQELTFKDKNFPTQQNQSINKNQLSIF